MLSAAQCLGLAVLDLLRLDPGLLGLLLEGGLLHRPLLKGLWDLGFLRERLNLSQDLFLNLLL